MRSPRSPRRPTQEEQFEAQARALQADGYNGGVVARRMIEEHGMEEEAARALVGRLYGKKVNPRGGDTTMEVVGGLVRLVAGLGGTVVLFNFVGLSRVTALVYLALLGVAGSGATKLILGLINAGAKDDLRRR